MLAHVSACPQIFLVEFLGVKLKFTIHIFLSEQRFEGNYSALDFQTNTIISHTAAYSSTAGHVVTNEKEEKYSYLGIHFSSN